MAKVDKLFRLIKAMQTNEKIFFKKMGNMHSKSGDNNYFKLFNAIDKQEVYNEEKIIKKFKNTNLAKYFASSKKQLYNNILRSLRLYNSGKDTYGKSRQYFEDAKILMNINLFKEALKKIDQGKKLAKQIDNFTTWLELLSIEREIFRLQKPKDRFEKVQAIAEEKKMVLGLIQNSDEYDNLGDTFSEIYLKKGIFRIEENESQFEKFMANDKLKDFEQAKTFRSKVLFYYMNYLFNVFIGEIEVGFEYSKKNIALWEANPLFIDNNPRFYYNNLIGFMGFANRLKKTNYVKDAVEKINALDKNSLKHRLALFYIYHLQRIYYHISVLDLSDINKFVADYQEELIKYELYFSESSHKNVYIIPVLYQSYTKAFIITGDYSKALDWNNKGLETHQDAFTQEILFATKLRNILIHYSLGNSFFLDSTIRSIERRLKKENQFNKYESTYIKMFKSLLNKPKSDVQKILRNFLDTFLDLKEQNFQQKGFRFFDIITWIEAELKGISMLDFYNEHKETH
jgi:hypothetical protein